jgi:hypothetical protein
MTEQVHDECFGCGAARLVETARGKVVVLGADPSLLTAQRFAER